MDVIDLTERPMRNSLEAQRGELIFVPFVNWLMAELVRLGPVEIEAQAEEGGVTHWHVTDLATGQRRVLAETARRHFRSLLGAIGSQYLTTGLSAGSRCCLFRHGGQEAKVQLSLGNEASVGFWFRGRSERSEV